MAHLVSILIPVYNARPWVAQAIESALAQTWPDKEVIVLDDGSTDGSLDVIRRYEGRVQIVTQPNSGQNVSRNALTRKSQGEWLLYLDSDDELAPDAVAQKMHLADDADAIYGTMEARHFEGDCLTGSKRIVAEEFADPLVAAFLWKYPNTSSLMFRRSSLVEVGGWNEAIKNCTDYDLYFRLLLAGKRFVAAPGSLSVYRQWSETQAVYEDSLRRTRTRLELMWKSVLQLEAAGRLTPVVRTAFCDATLGMIRTLYPGSPARALVEHERLRQWSPRLSPSKGRFPSGFRLAYRWLGFRCAERLATQTRFLRPTPAKALFAPDRFPTSAP